MSDTVQRGLQLIKTNIGAICLNKIQFAITNKRTDEITKVLSFTMTSYCYKCVIYLFKAVKLIMLMALRVMTDVKTNGPTTLI